MLLSIIIPVFNMELWLESCLDTCIDQDISDYEIICIDDGSADNSAKILDNYAKAHSGKIVVIHTMNQGVSEARNIGIKVSKGEYIWFIDSDDIIKRNCLNTLFSKCYGVDLIKIGHIAFSDEHDIPMNYYNVGGDISQRSDFIEYYKSNRFVVIWNYIVKRSILVDNNLRFGRGIVISEDRVFNFFLKEHIKSFAVYNLDIYFYRLREKSASHGQEKSVQRKKQVVENNILIAIYIKENMQGYTEDRFLLEAQEYMYSYVRIALFEAINTGDIDFLKRQLEKLRLNGLYPCPNERLTRSKKFRNNVFRVLINYPMLVIGMCRLVHYSRGK